jgi:hypothetical protein
MNAKVADEQGESATQTESSEFDALLRAPSGQSSRQRAAEPAVTETTDPVIEADIDGRRVRIVAKDEIVLECGNASITLRRNGRIVIKGTYVETCSEGTIRIKGGQVRIN